MTGPECQRVASILKPSVVMQRRPSTASACACSDVQDVNVSLGGPDAAMQALIGELDLKALEAVIER